MDNTSVVIYQAKQAGYPQLPPFGPEEEYPECFFRESRSKERNPAYQSVREVLRRSGLDAANFGTPKWNPLGSFIRPGQFVLLKPNLVKERHPRDPEGWVYTITHGSIIRAVADYVWKALNGKGRVVVADAPQTDSSFEDMVRLLGLYKVREFYRSNGVDLEIVDLRKEQWLNVEEVIVSRHVLPGDPEGVIAFDLGDRSEFVDHQGNGRYYGADYDEGECNRHHTEGRHEYLISASAVKCDVFINLPKLKTHKKAGITVNLKNLVGVNGDKNWLPHHTVGHPANGGDQYPNMTLKRRIEHHSATTLRKVALAVPGAGTWLLRRARKAGKTVFGDTDTVVRSGNWWGNDTTWRMCLDLNKIVLYGNQDGSMRKSEFENRKTYLSFVDGIIGGQGDGPVNPDPLNSGLILFGCNPATVDACAAVLMGFDPEKIPIVRNAFRTRGYPLVETGWREVKCRINEQEISLSSLTSSSSSMQAKPHFGWVGCIELDTSMSLNP